MEEDTKTKGVVDTAQKENIKKFALDVNPDTAMKDIIYGFPKDPKDLSKEKIIDLMKEIHMSQTCYRSAAKNSVRIASLYKEFYEYYRVFHTGQKPQHRMMAIESKGKRDEESRQHFELGFDFARLEKLNDKELKEAYQDMLEDYTINISNAMDIMEKLGYYKENFFRYRQILNKHNKILVEINLDDDDKSSVWLMQKDKTLISMKDFLAKVEREMAEKKVQKGDIKE